MAGKKHVKSGMDPVSLMPDRTKIHTKKKTVLWCTFGAQAYRKVSLCAKSYEKPILQNPCNIRAYGKI